MRYIVLVFVAGAINIPLAMANWGHPWMLVPLSALVLLWGLGFVMFGVEATEPR